MRSSAQSMIIGLRHKFDHFKHYSLLTGSLALEALLIGVRFRKRYINVKIQYNTIQYHTIPYRTIPYNTIQCNAIQCNTMQYNTIKYNTIQCIAMQCNTIQYNGGVRVVKQHLPVDVDLISLKLSF